jgi:hypothetical protein
LCAELACHVQQRDYRSSEVFYRSARVNVAAAASRAQVLGVAATNAGHN